MRTHIFRHFNYIENFSGCAVHKDAILSKSGVHMCDMMRKIKSTASNGAERMFFRARIHLSLATNRV